MTLKECYAAMEGDYEDALSRLRSERLMKKFVLKFLDDPSHELLCTSAAAKDGKEAFRAAHTIKGICQNLSMTRLYQSSNVLAEALRAGWSEEALPLIDELERDYQQTTEAIRSLKASEDGGDQ